MRGQYRGVKSETVSVASYQDELPEEKRGSRTETFVALKAWTASAVQALFVSGAVVNPDRALVFGVGSGQ